MSGYRSRHPPSWNRCRTWRADWRDRLGEGVRQSRVPSDMKGTQTLLERFAKERVEPAREAQLLRRLLCIGAQRDD